MFLVKSALTLLLLLPVVCSAVTFAQQRSGGEKGGDVVKPKAPGAEAELLRWKAMQAISALAQSATDIDDVPDRVRVLIEIADALWLVDEGHARSVFSRSFEEVNKLVADSRADPKRTAQTARALRYQVLSRVARRDPELANRLSRIIPDTMTTVEQKWADTYGGGTPSGEALLGVAQNLLATDPKQSLILAKLAAADGFSQSLRLYLHALRAKDQAAADSLFESVAATAAARHPARLIDVLFLWEYAFQPPTFYFGGVSWDREQAGTQYMTNAKFKRDVLIFAVNAIKENAQILTNPPGTPDNINQKQASLLYTVVQQILPSIQADLPASAAYISVLMSNLEGDLRATGQKVPTPPSSGETSESPEAGVGKLLERIAGSARGKARDDLCLKAAFQLFQAKDYDRAAKVAEKIDDPARRDMMLEPISFNQAGELTAQGKLEEALKVVAALKTLELRIMLLARVGRDFLDKDDVARGSRVLGEALALASKAEPSVALSSSVLSIALAFNKHDPQRSFESINQAIEIMNKLKADDGLWSLRSASGGAESLSITNLSWKASDNGGLEWVRVNYPKTTGLVEALSKAAQRDFDWAMTAAAHIAPKGLSLAVQATICRAAIESTHEKTAARRS